MVSLDRFIARDAGLASVSHSLPAFEPFFFGWLYIDREPLDLTAFDVLALVQWVSLAVFWAGEAFHPSAMAGASLALNFSIAIIGAITALTVVAFIGTIVAVMAVDVFAGRTASSALALPIVFVARWKWLDN